jgi:hypothetical protein
MAEIKTKISLDASGFQKGASNVKKELDALGKKGQQVSKETEGALSGKGGKGPKAGGGIMAGAGASIASGAAKAVVALGAAVVAAEAAMIAGIKSAIDYGGQLFELSAQTGVAVGDLAVLQQAFQANGLAAEKVGPSIAKMRKTLAGAGEEGKAADAFRALGLSVDDLMSKDAATQLETIGAAINGVENDTKRTALAMDIFGKSGAEMLTLFADSGGIQGARDMVGGQAKLLGENAALFDDISDKLGAAGMKLRGFFVGIASKVAPMLMGAADAFAKLDLSQVGEKVGGFIQMVGAFFKSGLVMETLKVGLLKAGADFINYLYQKLVGIKGVVKGIITAPFTSSRQLFNEAAAAAGNVVDASGLTAELDKTKAAMQGIVDDWNEAGKKFNEANQKAGAGLTDDAEDAASALEGAKIATPAAKGSFQLSEMARIGGGALVPGGSADPMLSETRKQTSLLGEIARKLSQPKLTTGSLTPAFA